MFEVTQLGIFATIFAILVCVVNILTQIFKSFLNKTEIPTRAFVLIISVVLTVTTFIAVCQIYDIPLLWYTVVAFVVTGFVVAYCAMFGYDNLYGELKELIGKLLGNQGGKNNE